MQLEISEIPSPLGTITMVIQDGTLCGLDFGKFGRRLRELLKARFGSVTFERTKCSPKLTGRIDAYLHGKLGALDSIPVSMGGTPFQQRVWAEMRRIPAGRTLSYGELAQRLGRPDAARAVGRASGLNPVALVVPCHRVVGSNGSLTGYAGGLDRKRWLLEHEGAVIG